MRIIRLRNHKRQSRAPISVALALALICCGACNRQGASTYRLASTSDAPANSGSPNSSGVTMGPTGAVVSYADVVSRVAPAVVTIRSQLRVRAPQQYPFMDDPFFRQFFGDR